MITFIVNHSRGIRSFFNIIIFIFKRIRSSPHQLHLWSVEDKREVNKRWFLKLWWLLWGVGSCWILLLFLRNAIKETKMAFLFKIHLAEASKVDATATSIRSILNIGALFHLIDQTSRYHGTGIDDMIQEILYQSITKFRYGKSFHHKGVVIVTTVYATEQRYFFIAIE